MNEPWGCSMNSQHPKAEATMAHTNVRAQRRLPKATEGNRVSPSGLVVDRRDVPEFLSVKQVEEH